MKNKKIQRFIKTNIEGVGSEYILSNEQLDKIAYNLAISFKGYPLFEYFSNYKYDIDKMTTFWKVSLNTMSEKTVIISDSDKLNSIAIFSPYDNKEFSLWKYIKAGGMKLVLKLGIKNIKRMTAFEDFALSLKAKYSNENCWYFYSFVTVPEYRGKGIGSKILNQMISFLDERKQDCYLETLLPVNVEIYKKYGFELMETALVPNSDLTIYAMLRKAK